MTKQEKAMKRVAELDGALSQEAWSRAFYQAENEALKARVAELEGALRRVVGQFGSKDLSRLDNVCAIAQARKALGEDK